MMSNITYATYGAVAHGAQCNGITAGSMIVVKKQPAARHGEVYRLAWMNSRERLRPFVATGRATPLALRRQRHSQQQKANG